MFHLILKNINETIETRPISEIINKRPSNIVFRGGWIAAGIFSVVFLFLITIQYEPIIMIKAEMLLDSGMFGYTAEGKNIFRVSSQNARLLKKGSVVYFHSGLTEAGNVKKGRVDSILNTPDHIIITRIKWDDAISLDQESVVCMSELSIPTGKESVLFKFLRQTFK